MDDSKSTGTGPTFPQLIRFLALKIEAERLSSAAFGKLESRIEEAIDITIQRAHTDTPVDVKKDSHRIVVTIKLDAKWRDKESQVDVATFVGHYTGNFHFEKIVETDSVSAWMMQTYYRDLLVAQVYPLAKNHMLGQVSVLGVNSNRRLGYDLNNSNFKRGTPPETTIKAPSKKGTRK